MIKGMEKVIVGSIMSMCKVTRIYHAVAWGCSLGSTLHFICALAIMNYPLAHSFSSILVTCFSVFTWPK